VELSLVVPGHQAEQVAQAVEGFLTLAEGLSDEITPLSPVKVGKALKGFRLRAGLTQAQLADKMREALPDGPKYTQRHVSQMEIGDRGIAEAEAEALASILNTDPGCFLL
jgi:hypothetical protein